MKVWVASQNPVKIESVKSALNLFFTEFEVIGVNAPSGVADQPFDEDTWRGAENRVQYIIEQFNPAPEDFVIGIEGGIFSTFGRYIAKGIVCISDANGNRFFGESAGFELADQVIRLVHNGDELGKVIDKLTNQTDSKRKGGAIGHLTSGVFDRAELYRGGIISALVPFLNKILYFEKKKKER